MSHLPGQISSALLDCPAGLLSLPKTRRRASAIPAPREVFVLRECEGADRSQLERFIRCRYRADFGARVEAFMPRLFSLRDVDGHICGALGLRSAQRRLFLEQYLDQPVERAIAAAAGTPIERDSVVEVGHFCGSFPGAVRAMIGLFAEWLQAEDCEWVTFTGTRALRNAFGRLGLTPLDLGAASIERLPVAARAQWGSYYDHGPRVLAGNIRLGALALHPGGSPGERV